MSKIKCRVYAAAWDLTKSLAAERGAGDLRGALRTQGAEDPHLAGRDSLLTLHLGKGPRGPQPAASPPGE